jgi:hypothetical protein
MNLKFTLTVLLLCVITMTYSQTIDIGQDARETKYMVEYITKSRTGYDSYGNSRGNNVAWDVKYFNGEISEVIQCFDKQFLLDFRIEADFCKYYIMENGKLAYILTQYKNVSVGKLKEYFDQSHKNNKVGNLYFSEDFKNYSKIFLHTNGLATVEWGATNQNDLPKSVKAEISKKLKDQEEAEKQRQLAEERQKQREKEIKSKTYDLQEAFPSKYNQFVNSQHEAIKSYFTNSSRYSSYSFPSFEELAKSSKKYERFRSSYDVHYKLEDNISESINKGYVEVAGSKNSKTMIKVDLISGSDKDIKLFKSSSILLPSIKMEGYEIMTEASIKNLKVDFTRGLTEVKIKGGNVVFKEFEPDVDLQQRIAEKLKDQPKGRYIVKYEVSDIMDKIEVITEAEKIPNKSKNILRTAGGIVLIGALLFLAN